MKLLVAIKRVIDPAWAVRLDAAGCLDESHAPWVMNPYDEVALEEALRLKEAGVAHEVLAVSCGPAACIDVLRTALALGADRALHVASEQPLEPLAVARLLAAIAGREGIDLILLGKQASDSDAGLTGPLLAGLLDWPQATAVVALGTEADGLIATEQREHGMITLHLGLPAVVTTDLRLNQPRYASLPNLLRARRMNIASTTAAELDVDIAPRLQTLQLALPPAKPAGVRVRDVSELIDRLDRLGLSGPAAGGSLPLRPGESPPQSAGGAARPLLCVECHAGQWPVTGAQLVGAGRLLAPEVDLLLIGDPAAAREAATLSGIGRVLQVDDDEEVSIEALVRLLADLQRQRQYTHLMAPATATGRAIVGRLGALLQLQPINDVLALPATDTFVRPIYAGALQASVRSAAPCQPLTVRTGHFPAAGRRSGAPATIERLALPDAGRRARLMSRTASPAGDLACAQIIVAGGRGLGSAANFARLLAPLAAAFGGALAATRSAVDAGFAPPELLVGLSGQHVAPRLYLAVGISGAVQHLAGIDGKAFIVAINKDAEAPIHRMADLSLVADLFTAVPELLERWRR